MKPKPPPGRFLVTRCDACRRSERKCQYLFRSGMDLWVCVDRPDCITAQPSLNVMAGGRT